MNVNFSATLKQVAEHYSVSKRTVNRWITNNVLTYGVEYVDVSPSNSRNAMFRFDIDAMNKLFIRPPETR